jgi:hypothetical protein
MLAVVVLEVALVDKVLHQAVLAAVEQEPKAVQVLLVLPTPEVVEVVEQNQDLMQVVPEVLV